MHRDRIELSPLNSGATIYNPHPAVAIRSCPLRTIRSTNGGKRGRLTNRSSSWSFARACRISQITSLPRTGSTKGCSRSFGVGPAPRRRWAVVRQAASSSVSISVQGVWSCAGDPRSGLSNRSRPRSALRRRPASPPRSGAVPLVLARLKDGPLRSFPRYQCCRGAIRPASVELHDPDTFAVVNPLEPYGSYGGHCLGVCSFNIGSDLRGETFGAALTEHEAVAFAPGAFDHRVAVAVCNGGA